MSAEVETMMYVGEVPWHGLGEYVGEHDLLSAQAIERAGLDWTVDRYPLHAEVSPGMFADVKDRVALLRSTDGAYLGNVSDRYEVIQNADAFSFMDSLVSEGEMRYHTAGSLRDGKRVWMLGRVSTPFDVVKGDRVDPYVFLVNGHDGTLALRCLPTAVRVVCANTVRMALEAGVGQGIRVSHSGDANARLKQLEKTMSEMIGQTSEYRDFAKTLAAKAVGTETVTDFLARLFPNGTDSKGVERTEPTKATAVRRARVEQLFDAGKGQDIPGVHGTAWALYNAVTEFASHEIIDDRESRFETLMLGGGSADIVPPATKLLRELVS